jgi:hypothetical protein
MMPAAEAERNASISVAPEWLAQPLATAARGKLS